MVKSIWLIGFAVGCLCGAPLWADGKIISLSGDVKVDRLGSGKAVAIAYGEKVTVGDTLITGKEAKVKVMFDGENSIITLAPLSKLTITKQHFEALKRDTLLNLIQGKVRALVPKLKNISESRFEVQTPNAVAGVRGTYFIVGYQPGIGAGGGYTNIAVLEGQVDVGIGNAPPVPVGTNFAFQVNGSGSGTANGSNPQPVAIDPEKLGEFNDTVIQEEVPIPKLEEGAKWQPPTWMEGEGFLPPNLEEDPNGDRPRPFFGQFFGTDPFNNPFLPPPQIQQESGAGSGLNTNVSIDVSGLPGRAP